VREIPFARDQGMTVFVEDVFHMIPARAKFLKSDATERGYIKKIVEEYALVHRDKSWILNKDGKQIWNL